MGAFNDLTGKRFGRLIVLERAATKKHKTYWRCRCDCGNETSVLADSLRRGSTKSCGCLNRETTPKRPITMRQSHLQLYNVWRGIKQRCHNPNYHSYNTYGGRGIKVCDEWRNSFDCFAEWADKNGYKIGLEIDRVDVDGDYSPINCRWVDDKKQANNRRNTKYITWNGETKPLSEWCDELKLPYASILYRLNSKKWSVEKALTYPVRHYNKSSEQE